MAALDLVNNLGPGMGRPGGDFVDAAPGLLDAETVDQEPRRSLSSASQEYAARIMTMLADDLDHR